MVANKGDIRELGHEAGEMGGGAEATSIDKEDEGFGEDGFLGSGFAGGAVEAK